MRPSARAAAGRLRAQRAGPSTDAFAQYLREIGHYPMLSRDEEVAVVRRARGGDPEALETLVRANLRFVVAVAKRYRRGGVALEDLVSEGNLGLLRAAQRFDEARGVRFISYAVWWIRQAVLQALAEQSRLVRAPAGAPPARADARRADADPSPLAISRREVSLDAPVGDEDGTTLGEVVADEGVPAPDESVEAAGSRRVVLRALACLTTRDAEIVRLHFGLDGEGPLTPEELGARLTMRAALVRQRLAAALAHLRRSAEGRALAALVA